MCFPVLSFRNRRLCEGCLSQSPFVRLAVLSFGNPRLCEGCLLAILVCAFCGAVFSNPTCGVVVLLFEIILIPGRFYIYTAYGDCSPDCMFLLPFYEIRVLGEV